MSHDTHMLTCEICDTFTEHVKEKEENVLVCPKCGTRHEYTNRPRVILSATMKSAIRKQLNQIADFTRWDARCRGLAAAWQVWDSI